MTRAAALLLFASGCTTSHGVEGGPCDGVAPSCRVSPASELGCCGPEERSATCVDGLWRCGEGFIPEVECTRFPSTGYCEEPPMHVDAAPLPVDAGSPPVVDAGTDCAGLGAAACFRQLDCAPVFDDRCCPSCSEGPCADCFDPGYVDCIPFDDCRVPVCGAVPSWGCSPSAPDCAGATPMALDSCSAYGCVPAYPPGEGAPSLADAICVPITGLSCTVGCRRLPPTCPSGTVPEADGSCYTDRCVPAFVCD